MRLGIDLGTTHTVVAYADRGNYPVVSFEDSGGDAALHFPSVVAALDGELLFGFDALDAAAEGATLLRSFKRELSAPDVSAATPVQVDDLTVPLFELMVGFVRALETALRSASNLPESDEEGSPLQAVVAVPAHAHATQRFLTLEAFRQAGIEVLALVNEPSAAGFEYTHRHARTVNAKRTRVVVYDLGGGTFDASLVRVDDQHHDVIATSGDRYLGGDDFDDLLACLAAETAGVSIDDLPPSELVELLDACREVKERITPNTKRLPIEAPFSVVVPVSDFYDAAEPLVARSLEAMEPVLRRAGDEDDSAALADLAGVYLVGGGSNLPLVARLLRERFGRRVHRSPYPSASTAIGLAIAADESAGFTLTDRFSRSFGVFREREAGRTMTFDPIVLPDAVLPDERAVVVRRRYRAAHNVGHYRFVECAGAADEVETGELLPFGEVFFPFDPKLRREQDLRAVTVQRQEPGPHIEERYLLDGTGLIEVEIEDLDAGYTRTFRLGDS